jgi:hypothetical protein
MRHTKLFPVFFLLLSFLPACKDSDPVDTYYDARQIEGDWQQTTPPFWLHWFSNGRSTQQIVDFNTVIYELQYHYRTSADTVFQRDLTGTLNFERVWTVEFPNYNTCYITEWGIGGDTITTFTLVRQ